MTDELVFDDDQHEHPHLEMVDIDDIDPGDNVRQGQVETADLLASIKLQGLLCPLLVRHDEGRYRLIAGNRRYATLREYQFEDPDAFVESFEDGIPCVVLQDEDINESVLQLTENSCRQNLTLSETIAAAVKLKGEGLSNDEINVALGKRSDAVSRLLRMGESLSSQALSLADAGVLSITAALRLCEMDELAQEEVVNELYGIWFGEGKGAATDVATEKLTDATPEPPAEDSIEDEDGATNEGPALTPRYISGRIEDLRNTLLDEYEFGAETTAEIDKEDWSEWFTNTPSAAAGFIIAMEVVAGIRSAPEIFRPELGL